MKFHKACTIVFCSTLIIVLLPKANAVYQMSILGEVENSEPSNIAAQEGDTLFISLQTDPSTPIAQTIFDNQLGVFFLTVTRDNNNEQKLLFFLKTSQSTYKILDEETNFPLELPFNGVQYTSENAPSFTLEPTILTGRIANTPHSLIEEEVQDTNNNNSEPDSSDSTNTYDINQDGNVNDEDLIQLKKALRNRNYKKSYDLNNNNRIDVEDAIFLIKKLLEREK